MQSCHQFCSNFKGCDQKWWLKHHFIGDFRHLQTIKGNYFTIVFVSLCFFCASTVLRQWIHGFTESSQCPMTWSKVGIMIVVTIAVMIVARARARESWLCCCFDPRCFVHWWDWWVIHCYTLVYHKMAMWIGNMVMICDDALADMMNLNTKHGLVSTGTIDLP